MMNYVKNFLIVLAGAVLSCLVLCRIDVAAISPGHYLCALAGTQDPGADRKASAELSARWADSTRAEQEQEEQLQNEGMQDAEADSQTAAESSAEWLDSIGSEQEREEQILDKLIRYSDKQKFEKADTSEFTYREDEDYVVITGYTGTDTSVTIPPVIENKAVTYIEFGAFSGNLYLEEVFLPDTVMEVGSTAFSDCKNLRAVTLGSGTVTIRSGAFSGCGNLKTVTKAENEQISFPLRNIEASAFQHCSALETIDLTYAVTINSYAFEQCSALKEISLERIVHIWDNSFRGCALLEQVSFPATLEYLGDASFRDCPLLCAVTFEEGGSAPLKIGGNVFQDSAIEELALPGRCEEIGYGAFMGCGRLRRFTLQDSGGNTATQSIGPFAFGQSDLLTELYLPATVEYIDGMNGLSNPDVVLYAPENSYARQYAEENNIAWAPWQ